MCWLSLMRRLGWHHFSSSSPAYFCSLICFQSSALSISGASRDCLPPCLVH
ncbi:hypothetical protein PF005_g10843 [Phytophthora fragariae]|uniref:Uncharacterized protein n=1 Tax=Phytophthora fragariae TaxID=53985 RepID=A0A6A3U0J4_9STRA|nr:hypothetical protein PF003_g9755 [Phytophthora fragariae]KAE8938227.1 hypothetical protein PF009_g11882 [Phytophthora fragariae]KAE9112704.1 hypothetical protein PF007_g11001 [Phytophthora fragariae]KAE9144990.1 hypothetical protein PF006_g10122 [Phytophthora fragariae]KAE9211853.1 hypothetical protein PF005_g10843 [Phytophthora fragariae]